MKFWHVVLCAFATITMLPVAGSHAAKHHPDKESPEFPDLRHKGNSLYRSGRYLEAGRIYEAGYHQAMGRGETQSALRFLNNLGSAHYAMFQYRDAIKTYLAAKDLAFQQNDEETFAAVYSNISSIYYQMGDMDAASESVASGLAIPNAAGGKFKAQLLILSAQIEIRRRNPVRASSLLQAAIGAARASHDTRTESLGWNELGTTLLQRDQLSGAEQALLEALRLRQRDGDDRLHYTLESLAELRFRQGDRGSAFRLYDQAIASAEPLGPSAAWTSWFLRGRARLAQNQQEDAYRDLGEALRLIRLARVQVLPADAFRVNQEAELDQVYAAFIESGSRLYSQTHMRIYAEQAFAAADEGRAASLRALWAGSDLTDKLPPEYWDTIVDLQQAEAALLHNQEAAEERIRHAHVRLNELEMQAGLDLPVSSGGEDSAKTDLLGKTQKSLGLDEVFISFHLGLTESCIWVVSRDGFEFHELPTADEYAGLVPRFTKALQAGSPEGAALGLQLYHLVFGSIGRRLLDKSVWIVAPEGPLFELPFAALQEPVLQERGKVAGKETRYLIEGHAISIVPGASAFLMQPAEKEGDGPPVGLGDPIYNRADIRLNRKTLSRDKLPEHGSSAAPAPLELARLPGSGREVRMCADIWRSHGERPVLLEGDAADKQNLIESLRQNPRVLHIAAHVVFSARNTGPGMLALTLQPGYQTQLLSATEVATVRARLGLVVLDGCNSARGAILPGAGLMGMTRAWMAAGARAVIATRWPMADRDEGELFRTFYPLYYSYYSRNSHLHTGISRVLQQAQLAQLRAGGVHAEPAYWASYFSVERN